MVIASPSGPIRRGEGTTCVLFKLLKSAWSTSTIKLPPNWVMAAAVSVSPAGRDENTDTGPGFASRPLNGSYDLAAEQEEWMAGGRRYSELSSGGEEDETPGRECQRRVGEDLISLSPEEIESRLERTRREFYNRRKIIIKNLPSDVSNQVKNNNKKKLSVSLPHRWLWLIDSFG